MNLVGKSFNGWKITKQCDDGSFEMTNGIFTINKSKADIKKELEQIEQEAAEILHD